MANEDIHPGKLNENGAGRRLPLSNEARRAIGDANRRHGGRGMPEYQAWSAMKRRCLNSDDPAFADYGGRGITVCDRWRDSFAMFLQDMGPRPSPLHTLDRVENRLGYGPSNCEWRTYTAQNRNRRNTVLVEYEGATVSLAALAERFGLPRCELWRRVVRRGWPIDRALMTPLRQTLRNTA